jgi:hypothetical protein
MAAGVLSALERMRENFDPGMAVRKLAALSRLALASLRTADQVRRLHEVLCFMRAYPDDARVLRQVERMLSGFARRADLDAHRIALAGSGIAGTVMGYPFFYPTAHWLSRRWPDALRLDRSDTVAEDSIAKCLPALMGRLENHALRESHLAGYRALDAMRGRRSDATFLLDRIAAMPGDSFTREALYDLINPSCELLPGAGTPERTTAAYARAPRAWQARPLHHTRPDLRREIQRPPRSIRRLSPRESRTLIDLARAAMVARNRDLDAFAYGNDDDVWLCVDDSALAFALVGMQSERRAALPAIYGGLTLRNGIPVGYHQTDFLGRTAAVSFNTFETFRGGESAMIFSRLLATLHAFGDATSFSIEPYQLGQGNDEGIESGAWWFYFKLGFRPRARAAVQLAATENARRAKDPAHRSSAATLKRLARHHLHFDVHPRQSNPLILPASIGLRTGRFLARLDADDPERALALAVERARHACGVTSIARWSPDELRAWNTLAPLMALMAESGRLPDGAALVPWVRAKAAASERGYALLGTRLPALMQRLAELSRERASA